MAALRILPPHWSYSFRDYTQRLAAQVPTAVYNMFNNSNEENDDHTIKYTQITSHQIWEFTKKKKHIFQNEAHKRFLQITVLMTLQPASRLYPPHLRGLRGKRRSEAELTGTAD